MRFGKAVGLLVAGLAVAAAVYAARQPFEPRDAVVDAGQPATPVEQARVDSASEPSTRVETDARPAHAAPSPEAVIETVVETARSDGTAVTGPTPSGDPSAPAGSLRDPRALIGGDAPERSADAAASLAPESGSPVANDRDTSLGAAGLALLDSRPLTATPATTRTSDSPAAEALPNRSDPVAVPLQDARVLAQAPVISFAAPSLSAGQADVRPALAVLDPFRDERGLAASAGKDAVALQDARALVPADQGATAAQRPTSESPLSKRPAQTEAGARPDDNRVAAQVPQASQATATAKDGAGCGGPVITTTALDSGRMQLLLKSECRANQDVQLAYGGAVLIRRLDSGGQLDFTLDAFVGSTSALDITLADGRRESVPVAANDLDRLAKVAVIWRTPVNLDLHAFEYASPFGQAGHVWERKPVTRVVAQEVMRAGRRGRGFLSSADDGRSVGDKLEVYTFFHHDEQAAGVVGLSVDYETRGELPIGATCGTGAYAEVAYEFSILNRAGQVTRESGVLAAAPCGVRVAPEVRFDPLLLPALRVRK